MTVAAVILAAGAGRRFAGPEHKLRAVLDGRPVVAHAVDHARTAGLDETIVVTGAAPLDDVLPAGVTVVANPEWEAGLASSLQAGIQVAREHHHTAVVVAPGDVPGLEPAAWRAVARSGWPIAVATYDGTRGHPVRLAADVWGDLPTRGDAGARHLIDSWPHLVQEIPCPGRPRDIDTWEDLTAWS